MNVETIRQRLAEAKRSTLWSLTSGDTLAILDFIFTEPSPQPAPVRDEQDGIPQCPKSKDGVHKWFYPSNVLAKAYGYQVCATCGALKPASKQGGEQASEHEPEAVAVRLANKTVNEWIGVSPSASMSAQAECKLRAGIAAAIAAGLADQREQHERELRAAWQAGYDARCALRESVSSECRKDLDAIRASARAAPEEQRRVLGREREKTS